MINTKLYIGGEALQRIKAFIDLCEYEISGLGKVEKLEDGYRIVDACILKQKVTGTTTVLDDDALGKFAFDLTKKGEKIQDWCVWWHSHVNMQAYFSGTDERTIEDTKEQNILVSLVGNKRGEWEARLDIHRPFHTSAELEVVEESGLNNKDYNNAVKQIEALEKKLDKQYPNASFLLHYEIETLEDDNIKKICEDQIRQLVQKPKLKWNKKKTPLLTYSKEMNDEIIRRTEAKPIMQMTPAQMWERYRELETKPEHQLTEAEWMEYDYLLGELGLEDMTDSQHSFGFHH